jgi:hypothetical protein
MICWNDQTGQQYYDETGYSGTGQGRNNPDIQDVPYVGPIPRGLWYWGTPFNQPGGMGQNVIPLIPAPENTCRDTPRNCYSFYAHGNDEEDDASRGCIVLPANRTQIPPGERIYVVP